MGILMRLDLCARQEFRGHGADNRPARRVKTADDVVHYWHGNVGEPVPTGFFFDRYARPIGKVSENQYDRLGFPVHVVGLLTVLLLSPGVVILSEDGLTQGIAVDRPEFPDRYINIHMSRSK